MFGTSVNCLYMHGPPVLYFETWKCMNGHSCSNTIMRDIKESAQIWLHMQYILEHTKSEKINLE